MHTNKEDDVDDKEEYEAALVARYARVTGQAVPIGLRDVLHVLAHPDVINQTLDYFNEVANKE